ncbi:hypothetical protein [Desertimonas flava]|uniref:sunset domain-containing protein n=1 Tax=Desertimonas flava TaxID=2064846 RepID=UPI000E3414EE|nr:hypothetical protein [Desertimonas flava]
MAGAFKALGTSGGGSGGTPPGGAGRPSPSGGPSPSPRRAEARSEPGADDTVTEDVTATVVTLNRVRTTESATSETAADWVEGGDGHTAPDGFPIKVNVRSGIYHVPGGRVYERTNADRWYRTTEAAEADGFRASKTT